MAHPHPKPHYHVCAGLICREGSFLISRRAKGTHLAGLWEFPGGKQERGEGLAACLERELKEELGIETAAGGRLLTVEHEYPDRRISLHVLPCRWLRGEPRPIQCQEVRWVKWPELLRLPFPPPDRKAIEWLSRNQGLPLISKRSPGSYREEKKGNVLSTK